LEARRSGFLNDSSAKGLGGIWTVICKLCVKDPKA
jgi:hypothetical protein